MAFKLHEQVRLLRDLPVHNLCTGDMAMLEAIVPGPSGEPQGAVLEFLHALRQTICVTTLASMRFF